MNAEEPTAGANRVLADSYKIDTPHNAMAWAHRLGLDLTDLELSDVVEASGRDDQEGPEWLPFYKAALGQLCLLAGSMSRYIFDRCAPDEQSLGVWRRMWQLHLTIGSVGPETERNKISDLLASIQATREFTMEEMKSESAWSDRLEELGFKFSHDGTAMVKQAGPIEIVAGLGKYNSREDYGEVTSLSLQCKCPHEHTSGMKTTLYYGLTDNPTMADVLTLCRALHADGKAVSS